MQEHPRHHGARKARSEKEQRGRPGSLPDLEHQPEQQRQQRDIDELDTVVIQERRRDKGAQRPREVRGEVRNPVDKGPNPLLVDPVLAAPGLRQRHEQRPGDHQIEQHEGTGQGRSPKARRASSRVVGPRPVRGKPRSPRSARLLPDRGTRPHHRPHSRPREQRDQQVSHAAPFPSSRLRRLFPILPSPQRPRIVKMTDIHRRPPEWPKPGVRAGMSPDTPGREPFGQCVGSCAIPQQGEPSPLSYKSARWPPSSSPTPTSAMLLRRGGPTYDRSTANGARPNVRGRSRPD